MIPCPAQPPLPRRRLAFLALLALAAPPLVLATGLDESIPPPNVLKKLTVEQLMDIDVTSVSKRPERLFDTASAVQVISGEDIRRAGATSLPEALRLVSNLEVAQIDSRQWAITARGFNNVFADKMLVLLDGRSLYTPLYAGVYWDAQDTLLADLDRIEVISGPGATQWGSNAVNGVINITTKTAKDTQGALITGGGGTEVRHEGGIRYGGQIAPKVYYRVYAKSFERDDSARLNGSRSNDAWRVQQGGFRVDGEADSSDAFTVQGDLYNGSIGESGPEDIKISGANLLGRWSRHVGPNSDWKLQVYFDHTHRRIPGSFTQDLDTGDVDFQDRFPLGSSHDLVWGFGYRVGGDDIINTPANAFLPPHVTRQWVNAFAQDEITVVKDRLVLTAGSKIEHNDYTGFEAEPSIRLAWTPDRQKTIWAAASRAVRTPSRIDRDLFSPATPPFRVAGGRNVVSEKLIAWELGYRLQVDPSLAVSIATFFNQYDDLRSLDPQTPPLAFPVEASSGLRGWSAGAELTAEWRANSSWRVRAGLTELRVHSEPQPGTRDRSTRDSIARDPNHQVQLRSMLDIGAGWECDATLRYVAPIANQGVPGYADMDLRLGWEPRPTWDLSLIGKNLLHERHAEFNATPGRREIERSVFAQVAWRY